MGGDDDKIIRIPGETLTIKVSPEEEAYRKKYLPDAKKLTDEKLVCTVCSVSLAQDIHKGKDIYIHRALQVLVCEACYNFYGDGSFSVDEDGDDKYCRWCGQGGTLFLCSACNCAFCQKCTKQNLKASVLAELENDDWKCYICNPRPLFGCRTICWGAQQLNAIGKEKEQERLKKIKERLEKLEAKKKEESEKRKSRKHSSSEDETSTKKRRRSSDGDDSSPEVMPKRKKRESRVKSASKNLNGSIGRRRKDSSSDAESEEYKKTSRRSRSTREKSVQSSSDDESDSKSKKDKLKKKKKKKDDSDDSSDSDKKKSKRRLTKKKDSSDEDSSEEEKSRKKKKHPVKKRTDSTDDSSDEKKKKKPKKKKNYSSSEESPSETKKKNKKMSKKKAESSDKSSEEDDSAKSPKKSKKKTDKEETSKKQDNVESDNEPKKVKKAATDLEDVNTNSAEDIVVKKRIKLAILWLTTIVKDISELGTLISVRATNFSKKKINTENLKSYEDVLNCVGKLKQLISGVHSNYDHIEKTLESHLKPWKILTGLEDGENENTGAGESAMAVDGDVSKADKKSTEQAQSRGINGTSEEAKASEKSEENLNNWSDDSDDQNETRAQISKINESLDKSHIEDQQSEKSSVKSFEIVSDEESKPKGNVKKSKESSKTTKNDSEKPDDSDSKPQKSKKNLSKDNTDAASDSENGERSPRNRSTERNKSNDNEKPKAEEEADAAEEMESEGRRVNKREICRAARRADWRDYPVTFWRGKEGDRAAIKTREPAPSPV